MRKTIILLIALLLSVPIFAQLEVKEGSFKAVPGFVNINSDPNYQYDDNNLPYAVIKVRTENITDKQRRDLRFESNLATAILLEYKMGEVWVYVTAKYANYLKISHPDFSSIEFTIPFDLEPKKGYEMLLVNKTLSEKTGFGAITINTIPENGAQVFLNGRDMKTVTPYNNNVMSAGNYSISVSKDGYKSVTKEFSINDGDKTVLNIEMPNAYGNIEIKTEPAGVNIYIDNNYYGVSPISLYGKIRTGYHELKLEKNNCLTFTKLFRLEEEIPLNLFEILQTSKKVNITAGKVGNAIYIDDKYAGTSPLQTSLEFGQHKISAIEDGVSIDKTVNIELSTEQQFIQLDFINTISIKSDVDGSDVFIDNEMVGKTPYKGKVKCGEHLITVKGLFNDSERTVNVKADDELNEYVFDLDTERTVKKKNRYRFYGNMFFRGWYLGGFVGFNNIFYNGDYIKSIKDGFVNDDVAWYKDIVGTANRTNMSIRFVGGLSVEKRILPYLFVEADMLAYQKRFKFNDFKLNDLNYNYYSENYSYVSIPLILRINLNDHEYALDELGLGFGYQWDFCYDAISKAKINEINDGAEIQKSLVKDVDYIAKNQSLTFIITAGSLIRGNSFTDRTILYGSLRLNFPLTKLTPQKDINFTTAMLTIGLRFSVINWKWDKYKIK